MHTEKTPLLIGLHAARANLVPGFIVQGVMLALLVAYYNVPSVHGWLEVLAAAKQKGGYPFSAGASAIAGGILPEILTIIAFQRCRVRLENVKNIFFTMPFWALDGILVDALYRYQTVLFGGQVDFPTLLKKVLVDQGGFTPFVSTPMGVTFYEWKNSGYSFGVLAHWASPSYFKNKVFPALIASWGVWIPLVTIIYALPPLLQFPMFSLGLTFWVMLFNYITTSQKAKNALPISSPVGEASALSS